MLLFHPIPAADPREGNLPLWAQKQMKQLRMMCGDYQHAAEAARLDTKPAETNTVLDGYADIPIGLPNNANVMFKLAKQRIEARVSEENGRLLVMGSEGLFVYPQASNVVQIGSSR